MPITWKNVAPTSPASILESARKASQQVGEGVAGLGQAISGYADERTQLETDAFLQGLTGTDADLQAKKIAAADTAWLDMSRITEAQKEVEKTQAEQDWWKQQQDIKTVDQMIVDQAKHEQKLEQIQEKGTYDKKAGAGITKAKFQKALEDRFGKVVSEPNLFGFADTEVEDLFKTMDTYFAGQNFNNRERERAMKALLPHISRSEAGWNELHFGSGDSGFLWTDDPESFSTTQFDALLQNAGFQRDKKKTESK